MELRRSIYQKLIQWKKENSGKVLEVSGARQVGKTYILQKFAKEQYQQSVYINMAELSGTRFIQCLDQAEDWTPGTPMKEDTLHEAVRLLFPAFQDTEDTLILIDEIQESSRVYNLIRTFSRQFSCHVIVTGSYLGRLLSKDFFLPAGDIDTITMETLTFEEFAEAFGEKSLYDCIDLYGDSAAEDYEELRECFRIYQQIGGYPSVVKLYLEHQDIRRCDTELQRLMDIFTSESKRYFEDVMETTAFERLFHGIAIQLIREKQGASDLISDLSKIVYQQESGRFTKKMINHAISWLQASHIIGYAAKCIDCDYLSIKENARFYFMDIGLARHFIERAGADEAETKGIVAENFVYLALWRRIPDEIAGNCPWFASYEKINGELDFFARSRLDYKNYGIEVKSQAGEGRTAKALLKDKKLDYLYYLKGGSHGGISDEGRVRNVPLYLADRITFDLSSDMK